MKNKAIDLNPEIKTEDAQHESTIQCYKCKQKLTLKTEFLCKFPNFGFSWEIKCPNCSAKFYYSVFLEDSACLEDGTDITEKVKPIWVEPVTKTEPEPEPEYEACYCNNCRGCLGSMANCLNKKG